MADGKSLQITGLIAGGNLASSQYYVVKFASTAGAVVAVNATTDNAIGILQNDPAAGEAAEIVALGETFAIAGTSNLAAGEEIGFNTTGRVIDHVTSGRASIGVALGASTATADLVRVLLTGLKEY